MALKRIDVKVGVIDRDYRGELLAILENSTDQEYSIKEGDRIAQLVFEQIFRPKAKVVQQLSSTNQGKEGFGSIGMRLEEIARHVRSLLVTKERAHRGTLDKLEATEFINHIEQVEDSEYILAYTPRDHFAYSTNTSLTTFTQDLASL